MVSFTRRVYNADIFRIAQYFSSRSEMEIMCDQLSLSTWIERGVLKEARLSLP
jgi:hypothetical protein